MNALEWIGVIAIVLFFAQWLRNIYRGRNPEKFSNDPNYKNQRKEFDRMAGAFVRLQELCDQEHDYDNEVILNTQNALAELIQATVPMPKESFASDYFSRYVDYLVIYSLANAIIVAESSHGKINPGNLKIG